MGAVWWRPLLSCGCLLKKSPHTDTDEQSLLDLARLPSWSCAIQRGNTKRAKPLSCRCWDELHRFSNIQPWIYLKTHSDLVYISCSCGIFLMTEDIWRYLKGERTRNLLTSLETLDVMLYVYGSRHLGGILAHFTSAASLWYSGCTLEVQGDGWTQYSVSTSSANKLFCHSWLCKPDSCFWGVSLATRCLPWFCLRGGAPLTLVWTSNTTARQQGRNESETARNKLYYRDQPRKLISEQRCLWSLEF